MGSRCRPMRSIEVLPQARHQQAGQVTILLHKPVGYVSGQPEDGHEAAVVLIKPQSRWRDDRSRAASPPSTRAAWRRPAGSTSTPPACWC
jgi:23S rRNA pseudouridine2604 synthase